MRYKVLLSVVILIGTSIFANDVKELENQIKEIDEQIQGRQNRVRVIGGERRTIAAQIADIQSEIKVIEDEGREIMAEITTVSRNIDYGERSLGVTSNELNRAKTGYGAKIIAWDKYVKSRGNNPEDIIVRKNFRGLLYGDLGRIEHIENVQLDIKKVTGEIEEERKKLQELRGKVEENKKTMDRKVAEQNALVAQLNREESSHKQDIARLEREKRNLDAKIKEIINASTKQDTTITTVEQSTLQIGTLRRPVAGNIVVGFGQRNNGVVSNGIEIASRTGTRITSAAAGTVVYAASFQGFGNVVMIDYGANLVGVYGNLISCSVSVGSRVAAGTQVGVLGKSSDGKSNFYYELRFNAKPTNPAPYFR